MWRRALWRWNLDSTFSGSNLHESPLESLWKSQSGCHSEPSLSSWAQRRACPERSEGISLWIFSIAGRDSSSPAAPRNDILIEYSYREGVKKSRCHAERSEASAFMSLKTSKCRFLASLGMTGLGGFFTPSDSWGEDGGLERVRAQGSRPMGGDSNWGRS